ncbi:polysaccharide pyruvyl transferase family protein [Mucilaginibacter phyllosphaerae]
MIIELRGVEFVNKGAELMLFAILERVKIRYPKAIITMQIGANTPKHKLAEMGIKIKVSGRRGNCLGLFIPSFLLHKAGYYLEREVNVVLDGSGFAFGDQWGAAYAERRIGSKIAKWHKQGKKIVLLAQAFGPFEKPDIRKVMEQIITNADLIFTREEESHKHLTGIKNSPIINQSPDFTNLIKAKIPSDFCNDECEVGVIPNYKMVGSKISDKDEYINYLRHAINSTINLGLKPFFLIHEGKRDHELAKSVNMLLANPLKIIIKEDPLEIKGIISLTKFVICSRFHGVVSALSQGVPCIVTSWSHKYEMLLKEYDFEEGLTSDLSDYDSLDNMLFKLAQTSYRNNLSLKLLQHSKLQKEESAKMWDKVYQLLDNA